MIEFVYFDAGGTLLEAHPSVGTIYARAGAPFRLAASAEALEHGFRTAWARHVEREGDLPLRMGQDDWSTRAWWRRLVGDVLDQVSFSGDREACFRSLYDAFATKDAWRVFEDVFPTLEALRARGIRMGILSNWDYRLTRVLEIMELAPHFDPVLISAHEGLAKPDPRFFALACARVGLSPQRILYVGDHVRLDLEPARAIGMRAVLIDRHGTSTEPASIKALSDLFVELGEED